MFIYRSCSLENLADRQFRALWILLAGLLSAGCGAATKGNPGLTEHQPCGVDEDCSAAGEVCSAHKVCLPLSSGIHSFGLELKPPAESTLSFAPRLAQHEVAPLDLDLQGGKVAVALPEAVLLRGSVMVVAESPAPLGATVTLSRRSSIPGRPKVMLSRTVQASGFLLRPNPDEVDPAFEAILSRDATYTIRALPDSPFDESFHPLVQESRFESDDSLWLMFGDPEASIYVAGAWVDALGEGIAGARVKAVDEAGGLFISSTGITQEDGSFHLRLPRGVRRYRMTFGPGPDGPGIPEISSEGVLIGTQAEEQGSLNSFDNPEDLGSFQSPAYPTPQRFLFNLAGRSSNGEDVVIPDATVTFSTQIGHPAGLSGVFAASAISDGSGVVAVDLVPGTTVDNRLYDVLIIPPASSEFAVEALSGESGIAVGAVGGAAPPITLSRRVAYAGQVLSAGLHPAIDLLIQARRLDGPDGIRGSLRTGTTKEEGRFSLKLDPGLYAVELIPPTGLPLPRWVLPDGLLVDASSSTLIETSGLVLPSAEVLEIRVGVTADQATVFVPGVAAAVYLVDDFCAALHQQDHALCDREPVFIGESITDADGRARVLVPGR